MTQSISSLFNIRKLSMTGCHEIFPVIRNDKRGCFVKVFNASFFLNAGLETHYIEEYYSVSYCGVIRGLHFQLPPFDHVKLIFCLQGCVQDVVVDLRVGSSTYGQYGVTELSKEKGNMLYIPKGFAHGFCVLSECATLVYKVSSQYSAEHDKGILWDSLNIPWNTKRPVLSSRDQLFPRFDDFASPFIYK